MRVTVEHLRPDMVLAGNLTDKSGRLLLATGTTLTEKHLRYCQMWGVSDVDVVGNEPPPSAEPPMDPAALAAARASLEPRFRHADRDHPVIEALLKHCVANLVRKRT